MTSKEKKIQVILNKFDTYANDTVRAYLTKPMIQILKEKGYLVDAVDMEGLYKIWKK